VGREEETAVETAVLIAKTPGYGYRSVNELIDSSIFGAVDFVHHLQDFLVSHKLPLQPFEHLRFPIYRRFTVMLPLLLEISDTKSLCDPIRTIIAEPAKGRKKAIAPQFDTMLAMEQKAAKPF
jgi:hypothetical protein